MAERKGGSDKRNLVVAGKALKPNTEKKKKKKNAAASEDQNEKENE